MVLQVQPSVPPCPAALTMPSQWAPNTLPSASPAPSQVMVVHQESTGQNSVTLLWQEPDQPNGIILEYEIKYYEKVTQNLLPQAGSSMV